MGFSVANLDLLTVNFVVARRIVVGFSVVNPDLVTANVVVVSVIVS